MGEIRPRSGLAHIRRSERARGIQQVSLPPRVTIGRFTDQVQDSGPDGFISIALDLTNFPPPLPSTVQPGDTWNFQAWFRDKNPMPTSNFTDGLSITFY